MVGGELLKRCITKEYFGSVRYIHYLNYMDDFMGVHICQNSRNYTLYSATKLKVSIYFDWKKKFASLLFLRFNFYY